MTYGYYIAATRRRFGDELLSRLARLVWRARGHRHPSRVDGVSVWSTPNGFEVRVVARDLFADTTVAFKPYPPFSVPRVHTK